MDAAGMPQDEKEFEELVELLEKYEAGQQGQPFGPLPEDLQELMSNVKRAKGQQAAAQQATQEVSPQPGYVIKTADESQRKVFINVCHSPQVPAPSSWADGTAPEKVLKALEGLHSEPNADTEAMRFAISVSELQPDTDKQGQPCATIDCIINSDVMHATQLSRPLKAFVNELCVDYVGRKHSLALDPKYKLPKMSYKGTEIRSQRVKLDPKPLVSDVTSTRHNDEPSFPLVPSKAAAAAKKAKATAAAAAAGAAGSAASAAAGAPKQAAAAAAAAAQSSPSSSGSSWQHEVKCEGRPVTHMVVSVQLPAAPGSSSSWSAEAVQVQLCGTQLKVSVDRQQQQQQQLAAAGKQQSQQQQQQQEPSATCIHLPFAARQQGAAAELRGSTGQLVASLPYLPLQQWVQQMEAEAPHAFSKLPLAHDSYMELDD